MLFLVQASTVRPEEIDEEAWAEVVRAERARGQELRRAGLIRHIWRVSSDDPVLRNVGVWSASDRTALDDALASLPAHPWMSFAITVLEPHPLDDSYESGHLVP